MGNKLRSIFFPTEEETQEIINFCKEIEEKIDNYYKSVGFSQEECELIREIEAKEQSGLCGLQSYCSRDELLQRKIITKEKVKEDIENWIREKGNI